MKRISLPIIILTTVLTTATGTLAAQQAPSADIRIDSVRLERNGDYVAIRMTLGLQDVKIDANRALLITPCIEGTGEGDLRLLPAIGLYSRTRYYHYLRANGEDMLSGEDETSLRTNELPHTLPYEAVTPYQPWMEGAQLSLQLQEYGCCNEVLAESNLPLATLHSPKESIDYLPLLAYVKPEADSIKLRSLTGKAYVDFPVNQTDIRPTYRNNAAELRRIIATIDSVKNDPDIRITALSIKGYASPEGSLENNERLARLRTEALKKYVSGLYDFPNDFISTDYEAEDWKGLRRYVEQSGLSHRQEILDIIDSDLRPDPKEWRLKSRYPDEYARLLRDCYPALRHSDYRVDYVVRHYTDVEEIRRVLRSRPQKLSLEEFYLVAQAEEPGSETFNEVFETAVRMYPDDETANLNAANSALSRKDVKRAERYLTKAGNSTEATHARALLALMQGDTAKAQTLLQEAAAQGLPQAQKTLKLLKNSKFNQNLK